MIKPKGRTRYETKLIAKVSPVTLIPLLFATVGWPDRPPPVRWVAVPMILRLR